MNHEHSFDVATQNYLALRLINPTGFGGFRLRYVGFCRRVRGNVAPSGVLFRLEVPQFLNGFRRGLFSCGGHVIFLSQTIFSGRLGRRMIGQLRACLRVGPRGPDLSLAPAGRSMQISPVGPPGRVLASARLVGLSPVGRPTSGSFSRTL